MNCAHCNRTSQCDKSPEVGRGPHFSLILELVIRSGKQWFLFLMKLLLGEKMGEGSSLGKQEKRMAQGSLLQFFGMHVTLSYLYVMEEASKVH